MGGYDHVVLYCGETQSSYREQIGSMLTTGHEIECLQNNRIGSVKAVGTTFLAYQIAVKFSDAARFELNAAYTRDEYYKYDHPYHFYTRFGFKSAPSCEICKGTGKVPGLLYGTNPCTKCHGTGKLIVEENLSTEDLKGSG